MQIKKSLLTFLLLISVTYGLWFIAYEYYLKPQGILDHFVTEYVTIGICNLLEISGYQTHYTIALKPGETYIFVAPHILPAVRVGASCNGLELLALFTLFIVCFPGNKWLKIPFIFGGVLLIHGINILRNYWLTLMTLHHSPYYNLFHRYVFIFMVYGAIFLLWIIWTNYFSALKVEHHKANLPVIGWSLLLLGLSFLKDLITPDYLNTSYAAFLNPQLLHTSVFATFITHPIFWLLSFLYSSFFILLPFLIIKRMYSTPLAMYTLYVLAGLLTIEYIMVFTHFTPILTHIVPKLNRYIHSPILLLFFVAAYQLNAKKDGLHR